MNTLCVNYFSPRPALETVPRQNTLRGICGANMVPTVAGQDVVDVRSGHAKERTKTALPPSFVQVKAPDFSDLIFGEFGSPLTLPTQIFGVVRAAFAGHVGHVVDLRSSKQVSRVNALSVVTGVADEKARGRRLAAIERPRNSVREVNLVANAELPITSAHHMRGPLPALGAVTTNNLRPETSSVGGTQRWNKGGFHCAVSR
jgi:hypothetical protein